ncbi:MAG TPA: hypothetical protein VKB17_08110 [Thermoleophilaceae bacterium]|nr:hypothetical protein [Thermoleophilaceae bacterium]
MATSATTDLFGFVQLEFGFLLGPPDGRYLVRDQPGADQPDNEEPDAIFILRTLGAPERRLLRRRRGRAVQEAEPEPVPTSRATLIRTEPFGSRDEAQSWLSGVRQDSERADAELRLAVRRLSHALHAQRVAAADPHVPEATPDKALAVRIGFGAGEQVADGRYTSAWALPGEARRRAKRSMEAPDERFAAILGGREQVLASEELVLRARSDLDAGRTREAALQARVALEALLAELPAADLGGDRGPVGAAANAALRGNLSNESAAGIAEAVERMEAALKRRRLGA